MWAPHIRYRISLQTALTLDCSRCGICRFKQAQEVQPDYVQYQPAGPTVQNMSETDTDTEYNNDGMNYSVPAGSPNKYKMDSLSSSSYIEDSTVKTEMENHASDYNAILEVQEECICTYCTFGIPSTNSYDAYAKQYLMAVLFSCKFCKFRTDDFDAYNVHTWNHLSYRYYICNFCPFTTFDESTIELHNVAHGFIRIPTYDCRVCGFRTREADDATKHLVGHLNFMQSGFPD